MDTRWIFGAVTIAGILATFWWTRFLLQLMIDHWWVMVALLVVALILFGVHDAYVRRLRRNETDNPS